MKKHVPNWQERAQVLRDGGGGEGLGALLHFPPFRKVRGRASPSYRSSLAPMAWLNTSLQTAA